MRRISRAASHGGWQDVYEHESTCVSGMMRVGVYLPPAAEKGDCPVLVFLSGLTCTEQNVITKGMYQRLASQFGIIVVAPDTSPRGPEVADDDGWDLGQGAGFYVNATEKPWAPHYQMYSYIQDELRSWVMEHFPANANWSITGHSMGGHGALVLALKRPEAYRSASAFSPIVAPTKVPWGHKAFTAYLGKDLTLWEQWDAASLLATSSPQLPIRVDQGLADTFLAEQLQPQRLVDASEVSNYPVEVHLHEGYDHSYFFISTFMEDHMHFHARHLKVGP